MDDILSIKLLDTFRVSYKGKFLKDIYSVRIQELIAWLLLNREAVQLRQNIAFQLWPESSEKQAKTNLRNLLYKLKKVLPEYDYYLFIDNKSLQWNPKASFSLDVDQFTTALRKASQAGDKGDIDRQIIHLTEAAEIYKSDLMMGCYRKWIEPKRESLKKKHTEALKALVCLLEERRQYQRALPFARKLIEKDEYDEAYYRQLMMLYIRMDKRSKALNIYRECKRILWEELNIEPDIKTKKLYERLKKTNNETDTLAQKSLLDPWKFVGRVDAWNILEKCWKDVLNGSTHFVLIRGEPGIGKTRFSQEFLRDIQRSGYGGMSVHLYPETQNLSYGLASEFLSVAKKAKYVSSLDSVWRQELVRIMPELKKENSKLREPKPILDEQKKQHFWQALSEVVTGNRKTKLLLLDDLHWADSDSLEWLAYMLHHSKDHPLLIAATTRNVEFHQNEHVQNFVNQVAAESLYSEILLKPLDEKESDELICALDSNLSDSRKKQFIFKETEGNPLFIVEYLRQVVLDGGGKQDTTSDFVRTENSSVGMPKRVEAVISLRLSSLSKQAGGLLGVAACIGRKFSLQILMEAASTKENIVESIEELLRCNIIRELNNGTCDFTHAKFREVAYNKLSTARKKRNHKMIAQAIQKKLSSKEEGYYARLGYHFEMAGETLQAVKAYKEAALKAGKVLSNRDLDFNRKAQILLKKLPESEERNRLERDVHMGLVYSLANLKMQKPDQVFNSCKRIRELSNQLKEPSPAPVLFTLAFGYSQNGKLKQASDIAQEMLRQAKSRGDLIDQVAAKYLLALTLSYQSKVKEAEVYLNEALDSYNPDQDEIYLERYKLEIGNLLQIYRDSYEVIKGKRGIWEKPFYDREWNHPHTQIYALQSKSWFLVFEEEIENVREFTESLLTEETNQSNIFWHLQWRIYLGWAKGRQGEVTEALGMMQKSIQSLERQGMVLGVPFYYFLLAEIQILASKLNNAEKSLERGWEIMQSTGESYFTSEFYRLKGLLEFRKNPTQKKSAMALVQKGVEFANATNFGIFKDRLNATLDAISSS